MERSPAMSVMMPAGWRGLADVEGAMSGEVLDAMDSA
jgi:hypothetical protein